MPESILSLARTLKEYIRELDHEAYARVDKGSWLVASLGTETFLEKKEEEILLVLRTRAKESTLTPGISLERLVSIARQWAEVSFYANEDWAENLVKLYEKHSQHVRSTK